MSKISIFAGFFGEAIGSLLRNRIALSFGALLTIGSGGCLSSLFKTGAPLGHYGSALSVLIESYPIASLAIFVALLGITIFSKGALILSFTEQNPSALSVIKKILPVFPRLYGLNLIILLSIIAVVVPLLAPGILTADIPMLGLSLAILGFLIFLPIAIVLSFVEIYAFFHIVLSKTTFRSSVRLAYTLFMSRTTESIIFGSLSLLFLLATSVVIGVCLGIGNIAFQPSPERTIGMVVVLFGIQTSLTIIQNRAWLSFFRFIAAPPVSEHESCPETSQDGEGMIQREVPEVG